MAFVGAVPGVSFEGGGVYLFWRVARCWVCGHVSLWLLVACGGLVFGCWVGFWMAL